MSPLTTDRINCVLLVPEHFVQTVSLGLEEILYIIFMSLAPLQLCNLDISLGRVSVIFMWSEVCVEPDTHRHSRDAIELH